MPTITLLSGNAQEGSQAAVVFGFATAVLNGLGHDVQTIEVKDLPTVSLLSADRNCAKLRSAIDTVSSAAGLVVASPVYRAGYSGLVQSLLGLLPPNALAGKSVFPLAVGGIQGSIMALDYSLRPLLLALGATEVFAGQFVREELVQSVSEGGGINPNAATALTTKLTEFASVLGTSRRLRRIA